MKVMSKLLVLLLLLGLILPVHALELGHGFRLADPLEQRFGLSEEAATMAEALPLQHPSKEEIAEKLKTVTSATTVFATEPSVSAPYATGALTEDFLESGLTYLNYIRFVAGLPEVTLSDALNENAQYGAVLLAAIDELTHYPSQPADMDDAFYNAGYAATTSSNLSARWGYYNRLNMLQSSVSGCMNDVGSITNYSTVGHRRWLLNPALGKIGFGYAESEGGASYIATKVFDRTGPGCDFDFVAWPVNGNHPMDLFHVQNPWSVTLNTAVYQRAVLENVKITITREADGKQWFFDSSTGDPNLEGEPYLTVNHGGYGLPNCIIFHPGSGNVDSYRGVFRVKITGIYYSNGSPAELDYKVDFFYVQGVGCEHSYEAEIVAPHCVSRGYTLHTCTKCGDSYKEDYVDALGHDMSDWESNSDGTESRYCNRCYYFEERQIEELDAPVVQIGNVASTGKIKLTWNEVESADKYKVYRSTDKKNWTLLKTTTGTSLTNTSAEAGKLYYYCVRAVTESGIRSERSNIVSRTCDLPRPVVTLSNNAATGKIKISWGAIDGAVKYKVYRSEDGQTWKLLKTTTSTSLTNTSTEAGKLYYYKVRAIAQVESANSAYSSVKSRTCDLPRPVVALDNSTAGKIKVTWKPVEGAVKYKVYRSTDGENWTLVKTTAGTSLTNSGLASGTTYYYKVLALAEKTSANSAFSQVKSLVAG